MSTFNRTDLKDKYNNPSTGLYKTGQNRGIGSDDQRAMIDDVVDSLFNLESDGYTGAKGIKNSVNTITNLKAVVTVGLSVPFYTVFRDTANSDILRVYELVSGTSAESSPTIIRPNDYAASTNEKVWKLCSLDSGSVTSGTYTPTETSVTNLDSTPNAGVFRWTRIGNIVQVSGRVTYDPTAGSTFSEFRLSLPIASDFAAASDCVGCGSDANGTVFEIAADITNNEAQINFTSVSGGTSASTASFMFTYEVL